VRAQEKKEGSDPVQTNWGGKGKEGVGRVKEKKKGGQLGEKKIAEEKTSLQGKQSQTKAKSSVSVEG